MLDRSQADSTAEGAIASFAIKRHVIEFGTTKQLVNNKQCHNEDDIHIVCKRQFLANLWSVHLAG